jgi:hypothetical protein
MKLFLATALVAFIVVGFPVWVVACMCKLYGSKSRGRGIVALGIPPRGSVQRSILPPRPPTDPSRSD